MKFRYDESKEELVVTEATRIEYHQLSLWLNRHVKGWRFQPAVKMGVWDGKKSYFNNGRINIGLWKECLLACNEIQTKFEFENKEEFPLNREVTLEKVRKFCNDFFKYHKVKTKSGEWIAFTPYDHQIESAYKILKNKFCLAEIATSGGKSLIVSIVYFYTIRNINKDAKILIVVPSITLVTQMYENIAEYNWGENYIDKLDIVTNKISDDVPNDYNPIDLRVNEIMSEKPRKWTGIKDPNVYIGTYQSIEKWPKEFFQQFYTVVADEAHGVKNQTMTSILKKTFKYAEYRFGVSGTFPDPETCEILSIQAMTGPKITEVSATELKEKGIITPMDIKVVIMNHNDKEFDERVGQIRKAGMGKEAFGLEKDYIHISGKRLDFIKKIVEKCDSNTLLLFHTIDYGQTIFNKLKEEIPGKEFFYIDGEISGKKREEIKKQMEVTKKEIEWTILNFGAYKVDVKSDFQILLSNGQYKNAGDITPDDDIDDKFIEKLKEKNV